MPAGNTYEAIATQTLGSAAASVTFSSIPGTYTDLVLVIQGSMATAGGNYIQVNGDTGNNYSLTFMYGDGTSAVSTRLTNYPTAQSFYLNTNQSNAIINFMNYSNTTTNKTFLSRANSNDFVSARVALWRSTAAINSITVASTFNYNTGTTFSLYGIKAA
jgi:hypothetical protein